eukprot:gene9979-12231_t
MRDSYWFVIPFSVLFQEVFRYIFYRFYAWGFNNRPSLQEIHGQYKENVKQNIKMNKINEQQHQQELQQQSPSSERQRDNAESNDQQQQPPQQPQQPEINTRLETLSARPNHTLSSAAIGVGSGLTYGFVMYGSIMWDSSGPGNLFSAACPSISLFMLSAIITLCQTLLHISFNVLAFQGYRTRRYIYVILVFIGHIAISYLTLFNLNKTCTGSTVPIVGLTSIFAIFTFYTLLRGDSIAKIQ